MEYRTKPTKHGNVGVSRVSFTAAEAQAKAMDENGCNNCVNCADCKDCTDCINCKDCNNCVTCRSCVDCTNCTDCAYCAYCTGCAYCTDCLDCRNCEFAEGDTYNSLEPDTYFKYTVVLICPDYLDDMTNNGLVVCHVEADSPKDAVAKARDKAARDFIAILDNKEAIADKYDFAVGAIFNGRHTNINPK